MKDFQNKSLALRFYENFCFFQDKTAFKLTVCFRQNYAIKH